MLARSLYTPRPFSGGSSTAADHTHQAKEELKADSFESDFIDYEFAIYIKANLKASPCCWEKNVNSCYGILF